MCIEQIANLLEATDLCELHRPRGDSLENGAVQIAPWSEMEF